MKNILKDKSFMDLVSHSEVIIELLLKESENGSYHKVYKHCDTLRGVVNRVNNSTKLDDEKKTFFNKLVERNLRKSRSILESNGFQQPEIYDLCDLISHVQSMSV
jgi:hypothetical protein